MQGGPENLRPVPSKEIPNAAHAWGTYESLMMGDPGVHLSMVRDGLREVAQYENAHGRPTIWATYARDAAVCIVAGIDPQTGNPIEDTEVALAEYEKSGYVGMSLLRTYHAHLLEDPIIQRELAREADYFRRVDELALTHPDTAAIFRAYGPDQDLTKNPLTIIGEQLLRERRAKEEPPTK